MVAHQRHCRSAVLAAHADLSKPDARIGEVRAYGQLAGEEFFNQQQDDPLAFGPYTVQLKALAKQVHAGKARYEGGYYAGFDHCDPAEVEAYTTYGKDYSPARAALSPTIGRNRRHLALPARRHRRRYRDDALVGSGLYVAGGVGGHSNGLIGLATYDGKVVADGIASDFSRTSSAIDPLRTGDQR